MQLMGGTRPLYSSWNEKTSQICLESVPGHLPAWASYVVHIVNISDDNAENSTNYYTIDSLYEKITEIGNYSTDFRKLLDRTIVGVYLSSDQQRDICKVCVSCSSVLTVLC